MADRLVLKSSQLAFGNAEPLHTFVTSPNEISLVQENAQPFTFRIAGNLAAGNLGIDGSFTIESLEANTIQANSVVATNVTTNGNLVATENVTLGTANVFKIQNTTMVLGNAMTIRENETTINVAGNVTISNIVTANTMIVDGLNVKDRIVNAGASTTRYYVKTTGSDANDGRSWDRAFASIKHAASIATSGSTIFVETGTYVEITPIRLRPRVSIVGDNLRNVILKAVDPRLDYFHVQSLCYLYGLRFLDLQRPGFCCAFPCAIAEATIQFGSISAITVLYSPSGYTSPPPVIVEAPENVSGVQATAVAVLTNGVVTGFTITNPGSGYGTQRPHVSIPAETQPFITGSPYIQNCSSITGPFTKTVPVTKISELTPLPYDFSNVDDEGAGGGCRIDGAVCFRGTVGSVTIESGGSGYTSAPTVVFSDGTAAGTATISGGAVVSVSVTAGGSYVNIPTVRFVGGGGSGAVGTVVMAVPPSPLRSFVADSFTQVNQGGPGHLVINLGYAQFVSCFTTFCSYSFKAVAGGFTNISTSVTDFGTYGLVSSGYWPVPIASGTVAQKYRSNVSSVTIATNTQGNNYATPPAVLFSSAGFDSVTIAASDIASGDTFGTAASMTADGTRAIVGAPKKTTSGLANAGAAYVFVYTAGSWTQEAKIVAPIPGANAEFGYRVAVSGDGTRAVVATYGDQRVYVYLRTGTSWAYETELNPGDKVAGDLFGFSLSVSSDGSRVAIGAPGHDFVGVSNAGAVYVFSRNVATWTQETKVDASDKIANAAFGESVSLASTNADILVIGAPKDNPTGNPGTLDAGSVYVFTRSSTTWTQRVKKAASNAAPSDAFGSGVAISADGTRWMAGAPSSAADKGSAYVFTGSGATWTQEAQLIASDGVAGDAAGYGIAVSSDGSRALVGAPNKSSGTGTVYVYVRVGTTWVQYDALTGPSTGAMFGNRGIASSSTALRCVIGAESTTNGFAGIYDALEVATGEAVLFVDRVNSVVLTNTGGQYSSTPTVSFIGGGGSGAEGTVKLTAPSLILVSNTTGRRPDIGSVTKYKGTWYTITGAAVTPSGYSITFYPPLYSADQNDVVYFYIASQVSTGAHVTEYIGSGVTYNALPEYGGIPNAGNKYLEITPGKVYFNISDHLGNQEIGKYFAVDQLTGAVTIKTDQFALSGLVGISFERGGRIEEVSNNPELESSTGAPDSLTVPTQFAVYTYVNQRTIPQGGQIGYGLVKFTSNDYDASWQSVVLTSSKNMPDGVAGLDASSRILSAQLPVTAQLAGNVYVPSTTAATPGYAFTPRANTGMFLTSSNDLAFSTSATERIRIDSSGNVGIGVTSPLTAMHVANAVMIDSGVIQKGGAALTGVKPLGLYSRSLADPMSFVTNGGTFGWYVDDAGLASRMTLSTDGLEVIGSITASSSLIGSIDATNVTSGTLAVARGGTGVTTSTGSGSVVLSTNPTLGGTITVTGSIEITNASPTINFRDTDHNVGFIHCNSNILYVLRGGTNASTWTQVNGQWPFQFYLSNNDALCGGNFSAINNVTAYASDRRLKKHIRPVPHALETLRSLHGVLFEWRDDIPNMPMRGADLGLIAQDLEDAGLGDLLLAPAPFDYDKTSGTSRSGLEYKTVHYNKLHGLHIEAIKELADTVDAQQRIIRELEARLDALENICHAAT
jgi:hypothetical protein